MPTNKMGRSNDLISDRRGPVFASITALISPARPAVGRARGGRPETCAPVTEPGINLTRLDGESPYTIDNAGIDGEADDAIWCI